MSKKKNEIKKPDLNEQLRDSIKEMRNSLSSLKDSVDTMNNSIQQIKNASHLMIASEFDFNFILLYF